MAKVRESKLYPVHDVDGPPKYSQVFGWYTARELGISEPTYHPGSLYTISDAYYSGSGHNESFWNIVDLAEMKAQELEYEETGFDKLKQQDLERRYKRR